jgi:hypothetical protein
VKTEWGKTLHTLGVLSGRACFDQTHQQASSSFQHRHNAMHMCSKCSRNIKSVAREILGEAGFFFKGGDHNLLNERWAPTPFINPSHPWQARHEIDLALLSIASSVGDLHCRNGHRYHTGSASKSWHARWGTRQGKVTFSASRYCAWWRPGEEGYHHHHRIPH